MKTKSPRIIEMVKKGLPDDEIMKKLRIKSKASLQKVYYKALVDSGEITGIQTKGRQLERTSKERVLTIGKRETILLSKPLIAGHLGFKRGDKFKISRRGSNIILKKIDG